MPRCPHCHRRLAPGQFCARDGGRAAAAAPGPTALPDLQLEGFDFVEPLGTGGFAAVHGVQELEAGQLLAMKIAHSSSPAAVARSQREALLLQRIGAPVAPAFVSSGRLPDGRPYILMEWVRGRALANLLEQAADPPPYEWACALAAALQVSLAHLHRLGIAHGDLSASNLLLRADGAGARQVCLLDYGSAAAGPEPATAAATSEYAAPERLGGAAPSLAADVYAFGVLLHELMTLRPPFAGDRATVEFAHRFLRPAPLRQHRAVPAALDALLARCLAKDPAARPPGAAALGDELARALIPVAPGGATGLPATTGPRGDTGSPPPPSAAAAPAAPRDGTAPATGDPGPAPDRSPLLAAPTTEPVVLVWADLPGVAAPAVAEAAARHRGFVIWQRAQQYLCGVSGRTAQAPLEAAMQCARALLRHATGRAALHLCDLPVAVPAQGPLLLFGTPVDAPETWLPPEPWNGALVTAEVAVAVAGSACEPGPPGFFVLGAGSGTAASEVALVGRDDLVAAAAASLRQCLVGRSPGLCTLIGDSGVGRSRLASELARVARECGVEPALVTLTETDSVACDPLLQSLGDAAGLTEVPSTLQELGAALRQRTANRPLVLIVDDAEKASDRGLDAVEYVVLDGVDHPLWIAVLAQPRFLHARPHWGRRARHHLQLDIPPLTRPQARELAAALLHPAEYPPLAALDLLCEWSGDQPRELAQLIAALKRDRAVRPRQGQRSWFLDTSVLDGLGTTPASQWVARRTLASLPAQLGRGLQAAAVLRPGFAADELDAALVALAAAGGERAVDAGAALELLLARGILRWTGEGGHAIATPWLRDGLAASLGEEERRIVHRAALATLLARGSDEAPATRDAIATHAAAVGQHELAARAWLSLGEQALRQHHEVAADRYLGAALEQATGTAQEPAAEIAQRAHSARGSARYRLGRTRDALADLRAARALAARRADAAAEVLLRLEEAIALDWLGDHAAARQASAAARALLAIGGGPVDDPALTARLLTAEGRDAWRAGDVATTVTLLGDSSGRAAALGDTDNRTIALLLLAPALVLQGELAAAEARFTEVISLCRATGDLLHLCAAHANRMFLWMARREVGRASDDLRAAAELARVLGHPMPERAATYNLAELLYWNDDDDAALPLAERALLLQQRFADAPAAEDPLLLARIHLSRGEPAAARAQREWIASTVPAATTGEATALLLRLVDLVLASAEGTGPATPQTWRSLLAEASDLPGDEYLEYLYWYVRAGPGDAAQQLREAEALLPPHPVWCRRFAALAGQRS